MPRKIRQPADPPLISPRTLSKSMREKSYVRYSMVPRVIEELGVRDTAAEIAKSCERDAEKAEKQGRRNVSRLLRQTAAIYRVAARRLARIEREAIGHAFGGGSTAGEFFRWHPDPPRKETEPPGV